MSRYVNVRGKHKHKDRSNSAAGARVAPQTVGAAPGGPSEAQMESVARERFKHACKELYKLYEGELLDASIARWKETLEMYDAERKTAAEKEGHRWTISPSIALRADIYLQKLLARREQLRQQCEHQARQVMLEFAQEQLAKDDSLCPSKQTAPANAASSAAPYSESTKGATATAPPIAA